MKKFVVKIISFILIFAVFVTAMVGFDFLVIGNQNEGYFSAALLDKVERLQSIDEPKIVLIGNSNLAFGIYSPILEEAYGMPVVNMGLHGSLGNAFHEDMVKLGVSEGDIVVVCHTEYADEDEILDPSIAWMTVEKHKELWSLIREKDMPDMIKAYPDYFKDCLQSWLMGGSGNVARTDICYSRAAFNEYGDVVARFDDTYTFGPGDVEVPEINDNVVNRLNALNEYCNSVGATMVVAGYPIGDGEYTPAPEEFDEFEQELRERLDAPVISHFRDYMYPYDLFYNTYLHLSEEGAKLRTEQLVKDLEPIVANQ